MINTFQPFVRLFSCQPVRQLPLQPAKQRKTIPFRHPKRPYLPDPINTDPSSQLFSLREDPGVLFVVREPHSLKALSYGDLSRKPLKDLYTETKQSEPKQASRLAGLSHPILAKVVPTENGYLPPPLRSSTCHSSTLTPKTLQEIRTLRPTLSLSQLSRKFGVSRLSIQMLGFADEDARTDIATRHELRNERREKRWSSSKLARREEKRARRSLW